MPTQIWIVEGNNESERGEREMYTVEWEKVTQIARAHGGHYCSGIGARYDAWRTFSGFAFRSEEGARAFEEEIALARAATPGIGPRTQAQEIEMAVRKSHWVEQLPFRGPAFDWAEEQVTPLSAWRSCERGDWLLRAATWLGIDEKVIALAALQGARWALDRIPGCVHIPKCVAAREAALDVIRTVERFEAGASLEDVLTADSEAHAFYIARGIGTAGSVRSVIGEGVVLEAWRRKLQLPPGLLCAACWDWRGPCEYCGCRADELEEDLEALVAQARRAAAEADYQLRLANHRLRLAEQDLSESRFANASND